LTNTSVWFSLKQRCASRSSKHCLYFRRRCSVTSLLRGDLGTGQSFPLKTYTHTYVTTLQQTALRALTLEHFRKTHVRSRMTTHVREHASQTTKDQLPPPPSALNQCAYAQHSSLERESSLTPSSSTSNSLHWHHYRDVRH